MNVTIIEQCGIHSALRGIALSYKLDKSREELLQIALKLCTKDGGHNKFLEAMQVWMEIKAPLYWWKQFDTYRIGVTKQSESTMHTIMRKPLVMRDFAHPINKHTLGHLNYLIQSSNFHGLVNELPDGYLQTRIVNTNYKVLRHIYLQRKTHKLPEWETFLDSYDSLTYRNLLGIKEK